MAATNDISSLDPAVIRAGRFDRHVRVSLPDEEARRSILRAQLKGRPGADEVDVTELARRSEGLTPAVLAQIVSAAAMDAMEESTERRHGDARAAHHRTAAGRASRPGAAKTARRSRSGAGTA